MADHAEAAESPGHESGCVFISYRRSDREIADRLFELLEARNVGAWYDPLIPHSADWREAIVEHLGKARVMVVLLSSAAMESDELRNELAVASQEGVPLLAVRLENVKPRGAFAYELARSQWFDIFTNPSARLAALADLLAEIARTPREAPLDSIRREWKRRWRELAFGRTRPWTRNNARLVMLFLFVSTVVFLLYIWTEKPLEHLPVGPLTAFFYLAIVATIGSPAILLSFPLRERALNLQDLPLLMAAAANTVILILLVWNLLSWIRLRFFSRRSR